MSVNKVMLVGHIGQNPKHAYTKSGKCVATFSVATTDEWKENGELKKRTEWHNVVTYGPIAEAMGKYATQGRQVYVCGSNRTRKYKDRNGQERSITEVVVSGRDSKIELLGPKQTNNQAAPQPQQSTPPQYGYDGGVPDYDDDLPFAYLGLQHPMLMHCC